MVPPSGEPVPRRPEQLTASWLTACLRHAGALSQLESVSGFECKRVGEGHGFAGELTRITLQYDGPAPDAPKTLIGKFATEHAATREMMSSVQAYVREVRFYREVSATVGVSTPRCYLGHYDLQEGSFLLLLEDLAPASSVDLDQGLTLEQAKLVLDQLATLHARWWGRVHEVDFLTMAPELVRTVRDRFQASLPGFLANAGVDYPEVARVARQIGELLAGDELLGMLNAPPLTLAHNDLHLDNVFLPTADGGRFALIDWQSVAASRHGTTDVTRILCVGLRPEVRREHQSTLSRHYHRQLLAKGIRGFGFRQLQRRFNEEMVAMAMIAVLAFGTLDFGSDEGLHTSELLGRRIESAIADARLHRQLSLMVLMIRIRRWFGRLLTRVGLLGQGTRTG